MTVCMYVVMYNNNNNLFQTTKAVHICVYNNYLPYIIYVV